MTSPADPAQAAYDEMERDYAVDPGYGDSLHDPKPRLPTPHMTLEKLEQRLDEMFGPEPPKPKERAPHVFVPPKNDR